jgi:hypothetical protein
MRVSILALTCVHIHEIYAGISEPDEYFVDARRRDGELPSNKNFRTSITINLDCLHLKPFLLALSNNLRLPAWFTAPR